MAITTLTLFSNRYTSEVYLAGNSLTVPVDASVNEYFILPVGFGQLLIESCKINVSALSGTYVAPAPPFDGVSADVVDSVGTTGSDVLVAARFVHYGTTAGRPNMGVFQEYWRRVLMRQSERIAVQVPIIAGAGITATVTLALRGVRIMTA